MKLIVLKNSDSSAYVEIITDLPQSYDESMNLTVMGTRGLDTAEEVGGLYFKELAEDVSRSNAQFSVGYFKQFAIDNNLLMDIIGGGTTDNIVEAGDITNGLAISAGAKLPPKSGETTGAAAVWDFDTTANVASNMGGKYFILYDEAGNGYYVWANCDGANLDPIYDGAADVQAEIAGLTGVEVTLTTDDTATEVADAIELVVDAIGGAGVKFALENTAEACTLTYQVFGDTRQYGVLGVADATASGRGGLISAIVETTVGAAAGADYSWTPTVVGNDSSAPLSYAVTAGSLPDWATMNATTGEITGTPDAVADTTFTIEVTDVYGRTDDQEVTISIIA